jgi:magnesium-transporting ATPase (P-type)
MDIPPRKKNDHLMSMQTVFRILRIGAVAAFGAWLSFAYVLLVNNWHFGDALNIRSSLYYEASTSAFLAISIFMILFSIHSRSDKRSLKELLASPNKYLYLAMAFSFLMVLMTLYFGFFNRLLNTYPLPISDWATPIVSAIIAMWLEDKFKQWFAKK